MSSDNAFIYLVLIIAVVVVCYLYFKRIYAAANTIHGGNNDKTAKYYIYDSDIDRSFKTQTRNILKKSSWNNYYKLREVDSEIKSDIDIKLVADSKLERYHDNQEYYSDGTPIRFSITFQSKKSKPKILINAKNWLYGVKQSGLSLDDYRTYVINHEFGHGLGFDHQKCNKNTVVNGTCPVMYQSTRGCKNYTCGKEPNKFDRNKKIDVAYLRWT